MRRPPSNGAQVEHGNRQRQRILEYIAAHQAEHGWAPTVREIADHVSVTVSGAQRYLVQLRDRGELVLGGGPRMIRLTNGHIDVERPAAAPRVSPVAVGRLGDDGRLQPGR